MSGEPLLLHTHTRVHAPSPPLFPVGSRGLRGKTQRPGLRLPTPPCVSPSPPSLREWTCDTNLPLSPTVSGRRAPGPCRGHGPPVTEETSLPTATGTVTGGPLSSAPHNHSRMDSDLEGTGRVSREKVRRRRLRHDADLSTGRKEEVDQSFRGLPFRI